MIFPLANLTGLAAIACVGGGVGYLSRRLGASAIVSLCWALPSGFGAAWSLAGLTGWLERGTREAPPAVGAGATGTVLARIPQDGTGEIGYLREGARAALPARSTSGEPVEAGRQVVIVEIQGGVATVAPLGEETR